MANETQSLEQPRVSKLQSVLVITVIAVLLISLGLFLAEKGVFNKILAPLSAFKIEEVKVTSEWPLSVNEVRTWLPAIEGQSLISLKPHVIIESLQNRPWVQSVVVKKQYPNRLLLDIETKRPQAMTLIKGQAYFLDQNGQSIEKVRPQILKALDLPFLSVTMDGTKWNMPEVLSMVEKFKKLVKSRFVISQVILGTYPYFKVYLDSPKVEVMLNLENWESQSSVLTTLLFSPPSQIGQLQRINLIFPKKAIVSSHN